MQPKQFVREATGFVREYGALDTLLFASVFVFALVFTITQFPWFYGNTFMKKSTTWCKSSIQTKCQCLDGVK